MRIQDMELHSGMDRATIRFYEKEGLIMPDREENGYRCYGDEDLQILQKIKLLRKLGVSLQKIKDLQQGTENFSDILIQQIEMLENRIQDDTSAKKVCIEMQRSGVDYKTLDSQHYLDMLENMNSEDALIFHENIRMEHHPWRRYLARLIDLNLTAALIQFLVVVVFRVRPYGEELLLLVQYASYLMAAPLLAMLHHKWGTTPGKWAMGIHIESFKGGKLDFATAFEREKQILWYGFGLFIPIYHLWCLYRSYKADIEGKENEWNYDAEILYTNWSTVKKIGILASICVTIILNLVSKFDSVMPQHKYDQITVAQFAKNYETYDKILGYHSSMVLNDAGKWVPSTDDEITVEIGIDDPNHIRPEFQYILSDDVITAVNFSDCWESDGFIEAIPSYCRTAMYTIVGSRPEANYLDLQELGKLLNENFVSKIEEAIETGSSHTEYIIADVMISLNISISNCDAFQNGMLISFDDNIMTYCLSFQMELQN